MKITKAKTGERKMTEIEAVTEIFYILQHLKDEDDKFKVISAVAALNGSFYVEEKAE